MAAVFAEVVPRLVFGQALIHTIGLDQPEERLARKPELLDRRLQRLHDGPLGLAPLVADSHLALELVERGQAVCFQLVSENVDEPGEAVDRAQMRSEAAGEQDRGDRKVLGAGAASHGGDVHLRQVDLRGAVESNGGVCALGAVSGLIEARPFRPDRARGAGV